MYKSIARFHQVAKEANDHIKKFMQSRAYEYLTSSTLIDDVKVITARDDGVLITTTITVPIEYINDHIDELLINSINNVTRIGLSKDDRKTSKILKSMCRENNSIEIYFNDAAYDSMCITGEIAQKLAKDKKSVKITVYKNILYCNDVYAFRMIGDFYEKIFTVISDGMMNAQCKK